MGQHSELQRQGRKAASGWDIYRARPNDGSTLGVDSYLPHTEVRAWVRVRRLRAIHSIYHFGYAHWVSRYSSDRFANRPARQSRPVLLPELLPSHLGESCDVESPRTDTMLFPDSRFFVNDCLGLL